MGHGGDDGGVDEDEEDDDTRECEGESIDPCNAFPLAGDVGGAIDMVTSEVR